LQEFAFSKNYKIHEYIKSLRKEDSLPSTMTNSTTAATKDLEKATLFNEYFYSVLTTSNHDSPIVDSATHAAAITNIDISVTEVYTALASLAIDPSKSPGIDGIGPNILKLGTQALCVPLHHLFKLCLSHCFYTF